MHRVYLLNHWHELMVAKDVCTVVRIVFNDFDMLRSTGDVANEPPAIRHKNSSKTLDSHCFHARRVEV